ncbi:MAG: DUF6249 domain-containing protein [Halieaceae bacterium]
MNESYIGLMAVSLLFGLIPVTLLVFLHKVKTKKMDTLVKLVELGGNVDPEMMRMLSEGAGGYKMDYKWGLIWLAIGVPLALGVWRVAGTEVAAFALIPVFIGIAYLVSGKYRLREPERTRGS